MSYMTEEEAKTKECCGPRQFSHSTSDACMCIGETCMAWEFINREHHRPTELWSRSKGIRVNSAYSDDALWKPIGEKANAEAPLPVGRCSLLRASK